MGIGRKYCASLLLLLPVLLSSCSTHEQYGLTKLSPGHWFESLDVDRNSHFLLSRRANVQLSWAQPVSTSIQIMLEGHLHNVLEHHFQQVARSTDKNFGVFYHYEFILSLWYYDDHIERWMPLKGSNTVPEQDIMAVQQANTGRSSANAKVTAINTQMSGKTRLRDINTSKTRVVIRVVEPQSQRIFDTVWVETDAGIFGDDSMLNTVRGGALYHALSLAIESLVVKV